MKLYLFAAILIFFLGCGTGGNKESTNDDNDFYEPPVSPTPFSLIDNGDGTITDQNRGLMWQQLSDDALYNWFEAAGMSDDTLNANGDINVCSELDLAGYTDWRLPSFHELETLVKYEYRNTSNSAIHTLYFPNTIPSYYWTTSYYSDSRRYTVDFGGACNPTMKTSANLYVRCVRGSMTKYGDFINNGDGTVTDNSTNLMWQQEAAPPFLLEHAVKYCDELTLGQYTDWRLPQIWELSTLIDFNDPNRFINTSYFPDTSGVYHSITNNPECSHCNFAVHFGYGAVGAGGGSSDFVKCVRN